MRGKQLPGGAIVLGMAVTHLGPKVIAVDAAAESSVDEETELAGLVAADDFVGAGRGRAAAKRSEPSLKGGGSSGCFQDATDTSGNPILPDLTVDVTASSSGDFFVGDSIFANIEVENIGRDCATESKVEILIPPETDFVGSSGCAEDPNGVPGCTLGTIFEHSSELVRVHLRADAPGTDLPITGNAATGLDEEDTTNNEGQTLITILGARTMSARLPDIVPGNCPTIDGYVLALDEQRQPIADLTASNFSLLEGQTQRSPEVQFAPTDPLSVMLVLDASENATDNAADRLRAAAKALADGLRSQDAMGIMVVGETAELFAAPSTDKAAVLDSLSTLSTGGPAALYDGIVGAADVLAGRSGRKALVMLADSADNASARTRDEATEALDAASAPMYLVTTPTAAEEELSSLLNEVSGLRDRIGGDSEAADAMTAMAARLINQYRLRWTAASQDGGTHAVTVTVNRNNAEVQAFNDYLQAQTDCEGICYLRRDLPVHYGPGETLDVRLNVEADPGEAVQVDEFLPKDWSVTGSTPQATFDAQTDTLTWDSVDLPAVQQLAYTVDVPDAESALRGIGGQVTDASGQSVAICGAEGLSAGPAFPADLNEDFFLSTDPEIVDYILAWSERAPWTPPPSPIPIQYVTKGAHLMLSGGDYHYDPALFPPYAVGTAATKDAAPGMATKGTTSQRVLPGGYLPGSPVVVELNVDPPSSTNNYAVEELVPEGWTFVSAEPLGTFDPVGGTLRWSFLDGGARTIRYVLVPPFSASGTVELGGRVSMDGSLADTGGETLLAEQPQLMFSDGFEGSNQ